MSRVARSSNPSAGCFLAFLALIVSLITLALNS